MRGALSWPNSAPAALGSRIQALCEPGGQPLVTHQHTFTEHHWMPPSDLHTDNSGASLALRLWGVFFCFVLAVMGIELKASCSETF
jgi:hypothetical protein